MQDQFTQRRKEYMDAYSFVSDLDKGGTWLHQEFYRWVADTIGIGMSDLPVSLSELLKSKDKHLNDITLRLWDQRDFSVRQKAARAGMRAWSLSDTVSTLKAYAHREIERHKGIVQSEDTLLDVLRVAESKGITDLARRVRVELAKLGN